MKSIFLYEVSCALAELLPNALIVSCDTKTDKGCGRKERKQAKPHHCSRVVLQAVAGELSKKKIRCLRDEWHSNEALAEVSFFCRELSCHLNILWQRDRTAPPIFQPVLLHDNEQRRHPFPNGSSLCDLLKTVEIQHSAGHQTEDVDDIRQAYVVVPIHSLQRRDNDLVFRDGHWERIPIVGHPYETRQYSSGQRRMFPGLTETSDMDFNKLRKAGYMKVKFVGELVTPARFLPDCMQFIFEDLAYLALFRVHQ